jgi:WD repeat-containing protein 35
LYRGEYHSALKTARRLVEYELELDLKKIYSILTLAGYYARNYKECSRALVKLEAM